MCTFRSAVLAVLAVAVVVLGGCGGSSVSTPLLTPMMSTLAAGEVSFAAPEESPDNPVRVAAATNLFPCVLFARGQFMMWTGGTGDLVYLSTSADGLSWGSPQQNTGLTTRAVRPRVVYDASSDRFEMWSWNASNEYAFGAIYHATSTDGVNWQGNQTCAAYGSPHRPVYTLFQNSVGTNGACQVILNPGATLTAPDYASPMANRYVMFHHMVRQADGKRVVGLAVSPDGITWGAPVERTGVLEVGPTGAWDSGQATDCTVIEHEGTYHMYYGGGVSSAKQGIGYASSSDGLLWSKAASPVFVPDSAVAWRTSQVLAPGAVVDDAAMRLYFLGNSNAVGLATLSLAPPVDPVEPPVTPDPDPPVTPDPDPPVTPDPDPPVTPDPGPSPSLDVTPPTVELAKPSKTVLWPPLGFRIRVTFRGKVTDAESPIAAATLAIDDEYKKESQVVDLLPKLMSDGSFCVTVKLRASRLARDRDGRLYLATLSAADAAGNRAEVATTKVICPHDYKPKHRGH
jgi:hypothetical protein